MDNSRFIDEETIALVRDEDYDNYSTPNTSRVDDRSNINFTAKAKSKTR